MKSERWNSTAGILCGTINTLALLILSSVLPATAPHLAAQESDTVLQGDAVFAAEVRETLARGPFNREYCELQGFALESTLMGRCLVLEEIRWRRDQEPAPYQRDIDDEQREREIEVLCRELLKGSEEMLEANERCRFLFFLEWNERQEV